MKKIFIATARNVGQECIEWAKQNTRPDFELIDNMQEADIIFSVLYDKIIPPTILKNKVCFNFHPGVLPEYKGAGSYSWVLINNDPRVSYIQHRYRAFLIYKR